MTDKDGWIEWNGDGRAPAKKNQAMPVPKGTLVDVKYRDGQTGHHLRAGEFSDEFIRDASPDFWANEDEKNDIIAYRVVDPEPVTKTGVTYGTEPGDTPATKREDKPLRDQPASAMTKFEAAAIAAMQGLLARSEENWPGADYAASYATAYATALMDELEKRK